MVSNGFRREMDSQNEGIQEHVPVGLQKLMHTFDTKEEQMKEQVSRDIQQHFIDDWGKIVTVDDLAEKLDDYENAKQYNQATKATLSQPYRNSYREKPSTINRRCHTFGEGYRQESNNHSGND
ncbi:retrovirus-related Pol polyprotein from transposon opus [Trichonephila clavipes]|nr:retrovirus-related Pol polyprotein from transposon opus [Trichonephila clavipes]